MSNKPQDTGEQIDVWEVCPHYDTDYDYLLTDSPIDLESAVSMVVESWVDSCVDDGEELVVKVKARSMTRMEYARLTETTND